MKTVAHLSRDQSNWLRSMTFEKVDGLTVNNRWVNWVDGDPRERADFLRIAGYDVLLPVEARRHPYIRAVRAMSTSEKDVLVLFLKDTSFAGDMGLDSTDVWVAYLALCTRVPGDDAYVATIFHETLVDPDALPGR